MNDFLQRLKQRKLVQWSLAYVAAAFALLQGIDIVAQRFAWPAQTVRVVIIALSIGGCFFGFLACRLRDKCERQHQRNQKGSA